MSKAVVFLLILILFRSDVPAQLPDSKLAADTRNKVWPGMVKELQQKNLVPGNPIFIRLFKSEHVLEIWVKEGKQYKLFKTYPICFFSGGLGTKTRMNDGKSPEGFYTIESKQLNPVSNYHLAINIGYPNRLEKLKGYTGTDIMIHGDCVSIGCYAMTDLFIDEIYTMVYKSLEAGQNGIPVHIFPFRMQTDYLRAMNASTFYNLWRNLKVGYDLFEANHVPPKVTVLNNEYAFDNK